MQRIKPPPSRNKIDLRDAAQIRAWSRRLKITSDELRTIVSKVGDSAVTVTKEVELQRSTAQIDAKHSEIGDHGTPD
jgi:Protein of unknown function (DUF3606)